jgi:glutathione S-transferase
VNPFSEVPILVDGDVTLRDLQAILIYLARKHGGETWFPIEAGAMAEVAEWLMSPRTRWPAVLTTHVCMTSSATN